MIYNVTNSKKTIAIHMLSNISKKTIKFSQLIEYGYDEKHFPWKIIYKLWWKNYSQTLFQKTKIERISGLIA